MDIKEEREIHLKFMVAALNGFISLMASPHWTTAALQSSKEHKTTIAANFSGEAREAADAALEEYKKRWPENNNEPPKIAPPPQIEKGL